MKGISIIAVILTVVGAINWGLVGVGQFMDANWNLVNLLLGSWPAVEAVVYILVGVSGLLVGWAHIKKQCTMCKH